MFINLLDPTDGLYPQDFYEALDALAKDELFFTFPDGMIRRAVQDDHMIQAGMTLLKAGAEGLIKEGQSWGQYVGGVTMIYCLLAAKSEEVAEDDIPFTEAHVDSGLNEEDEIAKLRAEMDAWEVNPPVDGDRDN